MKYLQGQLLLTIHIAARKKFSFCPIGDCSSYDCDEEQVLLHLRQHTEPPILTDGAAAPTTLTRRAALPLLKVRNLPNPPEYGSFGMDQEPMEPTMKTCIFLPPVRKPTGGVTVLRQIADILHQSGRTACLVARDRTGWRPEGLADAAPVLDWEELSLTPKDIWLVPEGWVNALAPGLEARARCFSYVQNWAYLFSSLPPGVTWARLPASFLTVSEPVAHFVRESTGRDSLILRPGIDRSIFHAPESKPAGKPCIAFMPRKNKSLAAQIRAVFENRNGPDRARWLEIEGMDTYGVAEALRSAHIFLMTGFPEGCPLPPLEAMACGCLPVGFTGLGGWDYMRQAQNKPRFSPWWPVRHVPWSGNGLWCADGDVLDAGLCLEEAVGWIEADATQFDTALKAGQQTADAYSTDMQRENVVRIWEELEK